MKWSLSEDKREARCELGVVIRQRGDYRVLISHTNGMTDTFWYYLWYSNPYTTMKPFPPGILDCCALFIEGTVDEWKVYLERAEEGARKRKRSLSG